MMKKIFTLFVLAFITLTVFSQELNTYKGVVINKDKTPVDVFSVVIFNVKDSAKQQYANTFNNGNFSIEFEKKRGENYGAYILSVGYEDMFTKLDALKDTITLTKKSMQLDDAVIKGTRDVKTSMGTYGGIAYDVSNTYLSDMGTSTQLLNFIPGLSVSDLGDVKLLGGRGDVVIYINNVKITEKEKLLSLKSEDIKSVEVVTSPGARFKGAKAVLYIKTNRAIDGFSSRLSNYYMVGKHTTYEAPSAEMTYTKNKVTLSATYRYSLYDSFSLTENTKKIDEAVYSGGWQIKEDTENQSNSDNHWYNASINYIINSKNTLVAEYAGSQYKNTITSLSDQTVVTNALGEIYKNTIEKGQAPKNNSNKLHLNYIGEYSKKFNMTADIDFSNRVNKDFYKNDWLIKDLLTGETSNTVFNQNEVNNGYAITSEVMLTNNLADKHSITYGLEHSFLHNNITSSIDGDDKSTSDYYLNSNFIKLIGEYTWHINSKADLTLGVNYMYSNLKAKNETTGKNYNNIAPSLSFKYYDPDKEIGVNFALSYENYQPDASSLNDVTVTIISPYEISRGNKNLRNSIGYFPYLSFTYKKMQAYISAMILTNDLISGTVVEEGDGKPLFVNTEVNHKNPITNITFGASYSNNISFWTTSIYASATYASFSIEQAKNTFEKTNGIQFDFYMSNQFKLPLNFYIYLNGNYGSRGYQYIRLYDPYFNLSLAVEKRFFKDNLSFTLRESGLVANKYYTITTKEFGIYNIDRSSNYGSRHCFSINASWRFNNHQKVQQAKDNKYLNML